MDDVGWVSVLTNVRLRGLTLSEYLSPNNNTRPRGWQMTFHCVRQRREGGGFWLYFTQLKPGFTCIYHDLPSQFMGIHGVNLGLSRWTCQSAAGFRGYGLACARGFISLVPAQPFLASQIKQGETHAQCRHVQLICGHQSIRLPP